ncbi:MAG: nucleotidyltransferase domain-containing protein [Betaproteobacteria bacterium]|jgi:predicted nucleotidyltransferase|nr:nucleotidyltransferase domain-containing protein [Betaproteobacteria bacterium]
MSSEEHSAIVEPVLTEIAEAARRAFGPGLVSVVLFGSAAENRLRASSDVNLMILLERVEQAALDAFREPLRAAHAAIRAEAMFLTRTELQAAAQLFPVKYSDMRARHRVLAGTDPFERLEVPEADLRRQTREILMNTALRLRERYVRLSIRDEQLIPVISDAAGPLRSAAAALARLEGVPASSPREALANLAAESGAEYAAAVANLSRAREASTLSAGNAGATLLALSRLAAILCERAGRSATRK